MNYITKNMVSITWDDGLREAIGFYDLPEAIRKELVIYFKELEDLRNEDKQAYDEEYVLLNEEGDTLEEVYS
jgi:hypothetical protein